MSLRGAIGLSNNIMISCIIYTFTPNLRLLPLLVRGSGRLVTTTHVLLGLDVIASFHHFLDIVTEKSIAQSSRLVRAQALLYLLFPNKFL